MDYIGKGKIGVSTYFYEGDLLELPVRAGVFNSDIDIIQVPGEWLGYIIVSRWDRLESRFDSFREARDYRYRSDDLRYSFLANIFLANRQVNNILTRLGVDYFSGERELLDRLLKLTLARHQTMFNISEANRRAKLAGYGNEIRLIRRRMGNAQSLIKKDFLNYWEAIGTGRDSLGRINKQVIGSKLIAAANRLEIRLQAIQTIYQKIQVRAAATHAMVQEAEHRVVAAEDLIRRLVKSESNNEDLPVGVATQLRHYHDQLAVLDYNPFCSQSDYMRRLLYALECLARLADNSDKHAWHDYLFECYRILRIKRIQFVLEEMIALISRWLSGQRNSQLKRELIRKGRLLNRWFLIYHADENRAKSARYDVIRQLFYKSFAQIQIPGKRGRKDWLEVKKGLIQVSKLIN